MYIVTCQYWYLTKRVSLDRFQNFMYYLYILKSLKDYNGYVGITDDTEERSREHNAGRVKSTKHRRPLIIIYTETFETLSEARKREWFYKHTPQGGKLKRKILETAGIPARSV